jgi:hypothetical protein
MGYKRLKGIPPPLATRVGPDAGRQGLASGWGCQRHFYIHFYIHPKGAQYTSPLPMATNLEFLDALCHEKTLINNREISPPQDVRNSVMVMALFWPVWELYWGLYWELY